MKRLIALLFFLPLVLAAQIVIPSAPMAFSSNGSGGGGGGSGFPGGSGTQLQYRINGTTFGGIPATSWDGTTLVLPAVSASSLIDTGLTSGRITFAGSGGLLGDSANLTYSAGIFGVNGVSIDGSGNTTGINSLTVGTLNATNLSAKADVLEASLFAADAGSTDDYVITLSPAITAYVSGTFYSFKANTANTTAATININGLGAKTIKKAAGGITTDLATNDIRAGQWVIVQYDGTNMQMQSTLGNASGGGGTPAGSSGDFQTNSSGSFGAVTPGANVATAFALSTGSAGGFQLNNASGAGLTTLTAANISVGALANGMTATTQSAADGQNNPTKLATDLYADRTTQLQYNAQTGTTYTLVLTDGNPGSTTAGVSMNNAASNTLTVPTNASVAFPVGWVIPIRQLGAGATTIAAAGGVTINSAGGLLTLGGQNSDAYLNKTATNTWQLGGSLSNTAASSQTIASGTAYTLTASNADVAFGTTSPIVTLGATGTYLISVTIQTQLSGASFAAAQSVSYNLRRTNNTAADISGSTFSAPLSTVAITTVTDAAPAITITYLYSTTNATDTVGIRGVVSATPSLGSVTCSAATINATWIHP